MAWRKSGHRAEKAKKVVSRSPFPRSLAAQPQANKATIPAPNTALLNFFISFPFQNPGGSDQYPDL